MSINVNNSKISELKNTFVGNFEKWRQSTDFAMFPTDEFKNNLIHLKDIDSETRL